MKTFILRGFTLLELVITLAIVAVLAAIAVPSYLSYLRTAEFGKTIAAGDRLRVIVEHCIKDNGSMRGCSSGKYHVPASTQAGAGQIGRQVIDGHITVTTPIDAKYGVEGATYILAPSRQGKTIQWQVSGSGCDKKFADCQP